VSSLIPLSAFKNKKIILLTHAGADVDSIAAAAALSIFLGKRNTVKVAVPEHISVDARAFAQRTGIQYAISPSLGKADTLILVDFNSWDMLGAMAQPVKNFSGKKYLLDHHARSGDKIAPAKNSWIEEKAVASCVLVHEWLKKSNARFSKKIALLLAAGITADSAHFLIADASTFGVMAEMLQKSSRRFSEINALLKVKRDFSEKIAMLKAAKRSRIFRLGNFIAVTAQVGAFEADAATALVKLGADIAFAGNSEDSELKISGRASQGILSRTGIDLARDVFQPLGKFFEGSGGGHSGAAAFNGKGSDIEAALSKCVELAKKKLASSKPGVQLKEYT
jgi:phosphoesterase RecJ-like protein